MSLLSMIVKKKLKIAANSNDDVFSQAFRVLVMKNVVKNAPNRRILTLATWIVLFMLPRAGIGKLLLKK